MCEFLSQLINSINNFFEPYNNIIGIISFFISCFSLFMSFIIKHKINLATEDERINIQKDEILDEINSFIKTIESQEISSSLKSNLKKFKIKIEYRYPSFAKNNKKVLTDFEEKLSGNNNEAIALSLTAIFYLVEGI